MRRRPELPPLGGVSSGPGEILVSISTPEDCWAFISAFGPTDGFSRELTELAKRSWPIDSEDDLR